MAPRQLYFRFVDKAASALVTAVETYNKPSYEYREETFALLALNAWELLLKARLLQLNASDVRCLYVYASRKTKAGKPSKKKYVERNPSKTAKTASLYGCINKLESYPASNLAVEIRKNLLALAEIRDTAAHYIAASPVLRIQILGIAVASVKNFVLLAKAWFEIDFAERLSLVLPLAFLSPGTTVESVTVTTGEGQLIEYLKQLAQSVPQDATAYDVAVKVDVRLKRSNLTSATKVQVVNDPNATAVTLTEEDILQAYPWTYDHLCKQLANRYADFSMNQKYHRLRKSLSTDSRFTWIRHLDPRSPKSGRKEFFSPSMLQEFDKHYALRKG